MSNSSATPGLRALSPEHAQTIFGPELVGLVTIPTITLLTVETLMGSETIPFQPDLPKGISGAYVWADEERRVHYVGSGHGTRGVAGRLADEARWSSEVQILVTAGAHPWATEALWRMTPLPKWIYGFDLKPFVVGPTNWTSTDPDGPPDTGPEVERFIMEASCQIVGRRAVLGGSAWEPGRGLGVRADAWATERISQLIAESDQWPNLPESHQVP